MKTREEIINWLKEKIAVETKSQAEKIATDAPFTDFGLDSIVIVTLVDDLEHWLEISLDPTVFWEFPSIEILSDWLLTEKLA
ncbi:MAG: acyl carrier protein [Pyrinomonadaceae bacterium]